MPSRDFVICLFVLLVSLSLYGCGSGNGELPAPLPSAEKSTIGCPGNSMPCSGSTEVPQILVNGTNPATYGLPMSCSVTAGSSEMKFTTIPSQAWFGVSPGAGTLQPGSTTILSVTSLNAANVSARNIGAVTVSAAGYADNNQAEVELNCNEAADTCTVAFSCDPKTNPLP
ncbi:MAG: hypothetical protein WBV69_24590 [Candidatus Sulfotelmatobacter sp.]